MRTFDAIILAGGASRRLGGADKPLIDIDGRPLIDFVIAAARGARSIIAVGPNRPQINSVRWCQEQPAGGGPVAALAAGLEWATAPITVVFAADLPAIGPAVPALLAAVEGHDAAVLTRHGRRNYLAASWRTDALRASVADVETLAGAPARALFEQRDVIDVDDVAGWSADCDSWADIEKARGAR